MVICINSISNDEEVQIKVAEKFILNDQGLFSLTENNNYVLLARGLAIADKIFVICLYLIHVLTIIVIKK